MFEIIEVTTITGLRTGLMPAVGLKTNCNEWIKIIYIGNMKLMIILGAWKIYIDTKFALHCFCNFHVQL